MPWNGGYVIRVLIAASSEIMLGSIFIKLNASSRTEAVPLGIRLGLIMV